MKKFFFYLCLILVLAWLSIESVDYPFQHEQKLAIQDKKINAVNQHTTSKDNTDLSRSPATENPHYSLSEIIETSLSYLRQAKLILKGVKCAGPAFIESYRLEKRFENLSVEAREQFFFVTGQQVNEDGLVYALNNKDVATEILQQRLHYLEKQYQENPTVYNNHQLIRFCVQNRNICSATYTDQLFQSMQDDTNNWRLISAYSEDIDHGLQLYYLNRAAYAPTNENIYTHYLKRFLETYREYTDTTLLAFISAVGGSYKETYLPNATLFNLCKSGEVNSDCEVLAKRLISDNNTLWDLFAGYGLLGNYYEAIGENELKEKYRQIYRKIFKERQDQARLQTPLYSDSYYDFIEQTLESKDEADLLFAMAEESKRLLNQDPDICIF